MPDPTDLPTATVTQLNPKPLAYVLQMIADMLRSGTLSYESGGLLFHPDNNGTMRISGDLTLAYPQRVAQQRTNPGPT